MAQLSDVVKIAIQARGGGLSLPGFGTPIILGAHSKERWPERVRFYTSLEEVAVDFPEQGPEDLTDPGRPIHGAWSPEYKAARAILSQSPHPNKIAIGRCEKRPWLEIRLTPIMPSANEPPPTYRIRINGIPFSYTYQQGQTAAQLAAGIQSVVLDAARPEGFHCYVMNETQLQIGSERWLSVEASDPGRIRVEQWYPDPGIAADLDAIRDESDDWYCIINPWNSAPIVKAIAAWTEANEKLFIAQTQDTEVIDTPATTATDVAQWATTNGYARTAIVYDPDNGDFLDAAIAGRLLNYDPGSETWAHKSLAGVPARKYSATHLQNMKAKRCGWYYTIAGLNVTQQGKVASASTGWIDVTRFVDWLRVDMQARIFTRLAEAAKVPFTDAGAAIIQGEIQASLDAGVRVGGLVPGSVSVKVPKAGDLSATDRANRVYSGITFTGRLAGAAHEVIIQGTVAA